MSRAQELVDAHFDHYVGPLLTAAGVEEKVIALCAFMYKSSGIHFYKHAQEDAVEAARGALANDAAHRGGSSCANCGNSQVCPKAGEGICIRWTHTPDAAHKAPSLCDSEGKQAVDYPFTFPPALRFMGVTSLEYVAKLREEVEEVATAMDSDSVIMELFDVIHAAETAVRSLGKNWNVDVGDIRDRCEAKNRVRGYYER